MANVPEAQGQGADPDGEYALTYHGPARYVGDLVTELEQAGVRVEYEPPMEYKGGEQAALDVIVQVLSVGPQTAIALAVTAFWNRHRGTRVDGPPEVVPGVGAGPAAALARGTRQERLVELRTLLENGLISQNLYDQGVRRIVNEI